jgi:hypothetical protein
VAEDRTLNDEDLEGFARRIAIFARQSLEVKDKTWVYLPSFQKEVTAEALAILKTVVLHERMQAKVKP